MGVKPSAQQRGKGAVCWKWVPYISSFVQETVFSKMGKERKTQNTKGKQKKKVNMDY